MLAQVEYPWQIWAYNAGVNPVVSPDSSQVQVPASCCVSSTNCSSSNPASIWPDDCYHKVRQASKFIRQSQHIIIQGVEYLQDHSAIMGSVTLAAAITMVRTSGYVSQKTCVVTYKRHQIFLRKYGDRYILKLDFKKTQNARKITEDRGSLITI